MAFYINIKNKSIAAINNIFKFRPDYKWPEEGSERNCPRCDSSMQLNEDNPAYFGKPWWCPKCQFQFSEEELNK